MAADLTAYQLAAQNARGDSPQIADQEVDAAPLIDATASILLNDKLLNLDRPVTVVCNGKQVFAGRVERDGDALLETLVRRGDGNYPSPVRIPIIMG